MRYGLGGIKEIYGISSGGQVMESSWERFEQKEAGKEPTGKGGMKIGESDFKGDGSIRLSFAATNEGIF